MVEKEKAKHSALKRLFTTGFTVNLILAVLIGYALFNLSVALSKQATSAQYDPFAVSGGVVTLSHRPPRDRVVGGTPPSPPRRSPAAHFSIHSLFLQDGGAAPRGNAVRDRAVAPIFGYCVFVTLRQCVCACFCACEARHGAVLCVPVIASLPHCHDVCVRALFIVPDPASGPRRV